MTPSARKPRARSSTKTPTASQIAPGVFVGGWADAEAFQGTRFCVLDEAPDPPIPAEVHIPIYDEAKDQPIRANLDRLAGLVAAAHAKNEPVLMFCGHGVRRGPLAGAWYLHKQEGIPLETAYDRIRAVRPKIEAVQQWVGDPSPLDRP
jgi:protein-tyrosine phosphatase